MNRSGRTIALVFVGLVALALPLAACNRTPVPAVDLMGTACVSYVPYSSATEVTCFDVTVPYVPEGQP